MTQSWQSHAAPSDSRVVVVGAAIVDDRRRVLAAQRLAPASMAGFWEFPGGKVEPGESEVEALGRECLEELNLHIAVGERIGPDVDAVVGTAVVRVYLASVVSGVLTLVDHGAARWLSAHELDDVDWLPADAPVVEALRPLLS